MRNTTVNSSIDAALSFDGLNPLLAKQLSELESQIGQLVQVQFELNQERREMRSEMDNLKRIILAAEARPNPTEASPSAVAVESTSPEDAAPLPNET